MPRDGSLTSRPMVPFVPMLPLSRTPAPRNRSPVRLVSVVLL